MIDLNVGTQQIKEFVENKTGNIITSQDVHNLRTKVKKEKNNGRSEGEMLVDTVKQIMLDNPGTNVEVSLDETTGDLKFLYIQTSSMAAYAEKYNDIMFVDGTYKLNIEGYPLYPFLVEDATSKGRAFAFVYVKNDTCEILGETFQAVKKHNPQTDNIKIIMVDKDFNEINILTNLWPTATILLCTFHVIKYFHKKVSEENIPSNKKE